MESISCYMCAIQNLLVLLHSSWNSAYAILDTIWITDKKSLYFKLSKFDQILHVEKAGFPRASHICSGLEYYICDQV